MDDCSPVLVVEGDEETRCFIAAQVARLGLACHAVDTSDAGLVTRGVPLPKKEAEATERVPGPSRSKRRHRHQPQNLRVGGKEKHEL
jgi:hypothetical protein